MNSSNIPYISREQTEALLNCFAEAIEKPASQPLLFNVWGIGGVGKTTLLDKLQEQHPNIAFARVYFGTTPDIGTPLKLMANLYSQLPTIYDWGAEFERFTELYRQYEQTLEQLKQPERNESESQTTTRKDAIKKLFGGGAKILSQFTPLKNEGEKIGLIAEGGVDLVDWLQKQKVTRRNKELQTLMLKPISKLTEAFVRGLIAKSQQQPVVLLLDTYEKTNSEIDNWLWQYLIGNSGLKSHSVRVVVAGRKNLLKQESWRKLQQDFSAVYSLEIERFTCEQTQNYLEDIGVNQSEVIYQVTKGLPYYLNWIREQKQKGKELDFSQGNKEIVNLLLQGLNKEQKRIIQLAACCRWFSESLIKYLVTRQELDFEEAVDTELNCFEWLEKLDFVEYANNNHRLDDVARDVFRLSLWQEDRDEFRQVHDLLAKYYEAKAIKEVSLDSSPRQMYESQEWKEYTAEFLYHVLFTGKQECKLKFLSHLFTACYFQETEVVTIPFNAITAELDIESNKKNLLSFSVKKFLQNLKPIINVSFLAFEEQKLVIFCNQFVADHFSEELASKEKLDKLIEEYELKKQLDKLFSGSQSDDTSEKIKVTREYVLCLFQQALIMQFQNSFKPTLKYCFNQIDSLDGLAKFVALLYQAKNSPSSYQLRYLQQAQSQAEKIIVDFDPEFSSRLFLWDLGNTFFSLDNYEEAIASYDKALEIKPDNDQAWHNRGLVLDNLGRYEEAIASYDKALEIKPDNDRAWHNRGFTLVNLGRLDEAIASYDKALKFKPNLYQTWLNRGLVLGHLGRLDEAIISLDRALKFKPNLYQAWYIYGLVLGNLGRLDEAIASYDKVLEIKPDYHEASYNRGLALGRLGRLDEAIASYDKALEINPDNDAVWDQRGIALLYLGRYEEALKSFHKALEIKPDNANVWYDIACNFSLQNQIESAIENLEKAISLDIKYQEMAKTDSDFDNIREDSRFQSLINSQQ